MHAPFATFAITSSALLIVGFWALIVKRDAIRAIMAIEIMFHGANLLLMSFTLYAVVPDVTGWSAIIVLISVEACVIAVMLAMVFNVFRRYRSLDTALLRRLRW